MKLASFKLSVPLVKTAEGANRTAADREFAIQQILDRAVLSTEIVDILAAAGITTPDISILSDEFLAEVQQLEKVEFGS
jgi:type I restriction enzyme, R subunit